MEWLCKNYSKTKEFSLEHLKDYLKGTKGLIKEIMKAVSNFLFLHHDTVIDKRNGEGEDSH